MPIILNCVPRARAYIAISDDARRAAAGRRRRRAAAEAAAPAVHDDEDGRGGGGDDVADDGIPFACHLCRGPFKDPIVTPCGHYLNEGCMLQLIRDANGNASCPVCGKDTHGVLNRPAKLIAKKRRLVGRDGTWEEYMEKKRSRGI